MCECPSYIDEILLVYKKGKLEEKYKLIVDKYFHSLCGKTKKWVYIFSAYIDQVKIKDDQVKIIKEREENKGNYLKALIKNIEVNEK